MTTRRKLLAALAGIAGGALLSRKAAAQQNSAETLRFPGDPTEHNVIYQMNKSSEQYHDAVLFSVGEMLRKYGDNITIVVTAFGPGIHLLGKKPERMVTEKNKQTVKSLAAYGVKFHACGNTMDTLGWNKSHLYDFAEVVQVGAADLLEHQEKGFAYISL